MSYAAGSAWCLGLLRPESSAACRSFLEVGDGTAAAGAYPGLTAAQLRQAHAYPYGGCAIQDLGYYPFGDEFFSSLLHYVRSGEFVQALLRDANSPDELAFAMGALSHYVGDSLGHSIATNFAVPVEFSKLRKEYGPWVTYDEDPHAHVQAEFAFDVNEISKDRFAPPDYLESVGLKVPSGLLSRAFEETYGIPLHDILGGSQHPNLFGYQTSVHHVLPRIAAAEAVLHARSMPADTPGPELERMMHELAQSGLENGWDKFRSPAGFGTHLLAGFIYITPKIGAPTMCDQGAHSPDGAGLCAQPESLDYRDALHTWRPSS